MEKAPYYARTTKDRICLKCDKKFHSVSPANRICGTCNEENEKFAARAVNPARPLANNER